MDVLTADNHTGGDLTDACSTGDQIGGLCVILPLAVNLVVMITMAFRGKGVDQEEEEYYLSETDTNNNYIQFPANQDDINFDALSTRIVTTGDNHSFKWRRFNH